MTGDIKEKNKIEDNKKNYKPPSSAKVSEGNLGGQAVHTPPPINELENLKNKLEECQKLKDEYLAGWQRERADLLNYKKGEMERIGEIIKYGDLGLILKILPILDNFDLVEKKMPENLKNDENVKGILQIKTQIQDFLKNQGVEGVKSVGEKFDPNFQEVVELVEGKDRESGIVLEEIQKGYKINGRLLRPAKVKVTK